MIIEKPFLTTLDVSWCQINAQRMAKLAKSLRKRPEVIRNLNISYNALNFNESKMICIGKEYHPDEFVLSSFKFFNSFCQYLSQAKDLMHLDICGLNFGAKQYA